MSSDRIPPPSQPVAAATVVLARDQPGGLEVLMLKRDSRGAFGGMWVFPGGRVDRDDLTTEGEGDVIGAARRAAVREAQEEAGLVLDPDGLVPIAHWTPPAEAPRRFNTWFFLASAPPGADVLVDGHEIHDHGWLRPADALARRDEGLIELAPPTWVTLWKLTAAATVEEALAQARASIPRRFETHMARLGSDPAALFEGDAGYEDHDATRPGPRHRLLMLPEGWRFEYTVAAPESS
jgi:8-oxo-dGTP pyrophosphatase MutT (NUDIX family)